MQSLGQADLVTKLELYLTTTATTIGTGVGSAQDPELDIVEHAELVEKREDGGSNAVDGHITRRGGGGNDTGTGEKHLHRRLGERSEQAERDQVVAQTAGAVGRKFLSNEATGGTVTSSARTGGGRATSDQAGLVHQDCTCVGDFHLCAICDGFQQTQERNLMRCQTGVRGRGRADLGDVHGAASEGR